jgi:GNAT superfamily N-acetyltransferase
MSQVENIWRTRSIEVHNFVSSDTQYWEEMLPAFIKEIKKTGGYVYDENGTVKAFVTFENRKDHIYIYELFTYESGHGIGPQLLNEVKEIGKPNPLMLHVYAQNVLAVKWYLCQGFIVIQPHEDNKLRGEIKALKEEIKKLQELKQNDTKKKEELKDKKEQLNQRLKYLMICPNYQA